MGMKITVNPTFIRRYEILRRIYLAPKTANELIAECPHMFKPQVISSISSLLHSRAIRKKRIPEEPPKATDEFFAKGPKRIKRRTKHQYVILPAGKKKLAFWEWKYQLYTHWQCPWSDGFNENYYAEMTHIIKNDLRLPVA
jgi:hypothetical protein